MRRHALAAAFALICFGTVPAASAQDYPTKPVRLISPYPPGGGNDILSRAIASKLGPRLGQQAYVENKPGANSIIGTEFIAKSPPDGYNLLFTSVSTHVIHSMQASVPYDSLRDFTPVATVSRSGYMLAVHPSVPARTLPELIAYARANPERLNYGSAGIGNANHLAGELFNISAGVRITHVPYKGTALAMQDLLAGRIQMYLSTISSLQQHCDGGALRALAYTSQPPGKPPVPTFEQFGLKDFEKIELVTMVLAPRDLPPPILGRLAEAVRRALEMPDAKGAIESQNQVAFFTAPQPLADRLRADRAKFAEIVEKAQIKLTEG